MIKQERVKIALCFTGMNIETWGVYFENSFKGPICEYEQTVGEVLTCSPPFQSYHDQVSQSAPQSGIDPKEYSIAWMVSQKKTKVSHFFSFSDLRVP